jgi:hypothetical protein
MSVHVKESSPSKVKPPYDAQFKLDAVRCNLFKQQWPLPPAWRRVTGQRRGEETGPGPPLLGGIWAGEKWDWYFEQEVIG